MKKNLPLFIVLVLVIIIVPFTTNSCKDNPPCIVKCDSILEAHPDAFQYLIFPEGSWWEFELLDSGIIDTLILSNAFVTFRDNRCVYDINVCKYNYTLKYLHTNSNYSGESADGFGCREIFQLLNLFGDNTWIVIHDTRTNNNASMGHFLNFPFNLGQSFTDDRFVSDTAKILPINGKELKCLQISAKKNQFDHEHRIMNFYMAKGIGIVRFEYQNGHIWQLKSHFINK